MFRINQKTYLNPQQRATRVSKTFFLWIIPVIQFFKYPTDTFNHFSFQPLEEEFAYGLGRELEDRCRDTTYDKRVSLRKLLIDMFFWEFIIYTILISIEVLILQMAIPISIWFILYYDFPHSGYFQLSSGFIILILSYFCITFVHHHVYLNFNRLGIKSKTALENFIVRKMLKVDSNNKVDINLEANIRTILGLIEKLSRTVYVINYLWLSPLQLVLLSVMIYYISGIMALIIFGIVLLPTLILTAWLKHAESKNQLKREQYAQERVKYITEFIIHFEVVKMYCCEAIYKKNLRKYRRLELHQNSNLQMLHISRRFCLLLLPIITILLILYANTHFIIVYPENEIFVLLIISFMVQLYTGRYFLESLSAYMISKKAFRIIEDFLDIPDKVKDFEADLNMRYPLGHVEVRSASVSFERGLFLQDLNFIIPRGKLCIVVGAPKTGKTLLVKMLLREIDVTSGYVVVNGRMSYCAQRPWFFNSSIRQNILFGRPYRKERYAEIIHLARLSEHLIPLHMQDRTLIEEIELSPEFRTKIDFARALYNNADIYIFDQPFYALDSLTALHLFHDGLELFLKGKTRFIVTNHINHMVKADIILVINENTVQQFDNYHDILTLLRNNTAILDNSTTRGSCSENTLNTILNEDNDDYEEYELAHFKDVSKRPHESVYNAYFNVVFGGTIWLRFAIVLVLLSQAVFTYADYYLILWASSVHSCLKSSVEESMQSVCIRKNEWEFNWFLYFMCGKLILFFVNFMYFQFARNHYGKRVHAQAVKKLLAAKAAFYINNRDIRLNFLNAMQILDFRLLQRAVVIFPYIFHIIGSFVILVYFWIWFIIPVLILLVLIHILWYYYNLTLFQLTYMHIATQIHSEDYVKSIFAGMDTIRAYNCEKIISLEYEMLQDETTSALILTLALNTFAGFFIDVICILYLSLTVTTFYVFPINITIPYSSFIAYFLMQVTYMFFNLHYIMKTSAMVVYDVACIKNFANYSKLQSEGPYYSKPVDRPRDSWPERGHIDMQRVTVFYESPKVETVHSLSITIQHKEKIAILGRHGSGAATVVGILFNIYKRYGNVVIDGVHIDDIGLHELRKRISIVPKHPLIISTTLRENIDFFGASDSQAINDVLDEVGLTYVSLDQQVKDEDYTLAEKQMISLARVLLYPTRIIIIHENDIKSTTKADRLLHQIVRKKFKDNTVITVSNKIGHLLHLDRIVIMDHGKVVADDTPRNLLHSNSNFLQPFLEVIASEELEQIQENALHKDFETSQLDIINAIIKATSSISRRNT